MYTLCSVDRCVNLAEVIITRRSTTDELSLLPVRLCLVIEDVVVGVEQRSLVLLEIYRHLHSLHSSRLERPTEQGQSEKEQMSRDFLYGRG